MERRFLRSNSPMASIGLSRSPASRRSRSSSAVRRSCRSTALTRPRRADWSRLPSSPSFVSPVPPLPIRLPTPLPTPIPLPDLPLTLPPAAPGAILINTARGEIVDLTSLELALRSNTLAGAALDVLPTEPIPDDAHSLIHAYRNKEAWLEGRLVLTPHAAFYSPQSFEDIRSFAAQTMRDVLVDGLEVNVIRPEQK